ncbi:transmembrane protease serine 9-like [Brachionus plicatilis]|uniref:Transmembrane protease serine 9-like n=1 Tax=Brachionus plicatilis TaxID=10195 RepID=A0A3M7SNN8_BRAPC|nr:transmembrane protease serine 9-like [Brachionus plicatilis]
MNKYELILIKIKKKSMIFIFFSIFILFQHCLCQNCLNGETPPFCDECGITYAVPNIRIVGGTEAVPNSWPSMALIIFNYKYDYLTTTRTVEYKCGGSVINKDSILTAAHCFVSTLPLSTGVNIRVKPNSYYQTYESMYKVVLGVHNTDNINFFYEIESFTLYPDYKNQNQDDVGIIRLKNEITYSNSIQPGCLPYLKDSRYPSTMNVESWAAGWGTLFFGGPTSNTLQNVKITLVCCSSGKILYAGEVEGGKDTCQGDSGGPLFIKDSYNGQEKYIIVGITSFGEGCALPGKFGGYMKVTSYLNWITEIVMTNKSNLKNGNTFVNNSSRFYEFKDFKLLV